MPIHRVRPRNDFESLFVRGQVLVLGINGYYEISPFGTKGRDSGGSIDRIYYLSVQGVCDTKLSHVEPNGQPVNGIAQMWRRHTELPVSVEYKPGQTEILHTAIASAGERDLLAFDLIHTIPEKGTSARPARIAVLRITPEERARTEIEGAAKPEVKKLGEFRAEFNEPFQAYVIGDDYYFLTKSGSVYGSPSAEKGKPRTMVAIWDNKKQPPVRFIISDGNKTGVHFLIYHRQKIGWEYFQFGPEPKPQLLTDRISDDQEPPVEKVYDLARVLRDKKLIVTPPKKP